MCNSLCILYLSEFTFFIHTMEVTGSASQNLIFQARVLEWGAIIYSTLGEMEQLEVVLKAIIYQELTIY